MANAVKKAAERLSAQQIIDGIRDEVRRNEAKVNDRRRNIAELAKVRGRWPGHGWRLRTSDGVDFALDQDRMSRALKDFSLKMMVHGRHVANLAFGNVLLGGAASPVLRPIKLSPKGAPLPPLPAGGLVWSNNPADRKTITNFIAECRKLPTGSAELQVQLQLVAQLQGAKTQGNPMLANLRPVMPFGFPTEMATVVDRRGDAATGNIDILARTGHRRSGELTVLELKAPSLNRSKVREAFRQAIGYAAALAFEANGADDDAQYVDVSDYWQLFADRPGPKKPGHQAKPLVVHAVVVLPKDLRDRAAAVLAELQLEAAPPLVRGKAMKVGVLLYATTPAGAGKTKTWTLDGGYEWLRASGA